MLLLGLLPAALAAQESKRSVPTADDLAIYTVVLDSIFGRDTTDGRGIVLYDRTTGAGTHPMEFRFPNYPQPFEDSILSRQTAEGYARRWGSGFDLRAQPLPVARRVILVTPADLPERTGQMANPDTWWAAFYQKFPRTIGTVQVSEIGYSPSGTEAIVGMNLSCGGLCGTGRLIALRRIDGRWRVTKVIITSRT